MEIDKIKAAWFINGKKFGYPDCCIQAFLLNPQAMPTNTVFTGSGYRICHECNKKDPTEVIMDINKRRDPKIQPFLSGFPLQEHTEFFKYAMEQGAFMDEAKFFYWIYSLNEGLIEQLLAKKQASNLSTLESVAWLCEEVILKHYPDDELYSCVLDLCKKGLKR